MAEQISNVRYQELVNEEEPAAAQPPQEEPAAVLDAPPPYSSISAANAAFFDYKEDAGRFPNPPSYNVATTLPSYDEAERTKAETGIPLVPGRVVEDDFDDADQLRIGNDGIFMLTFFMAFLFNWIGFFLSFCLTTSAAGRYGAISGFGLSLIKWVLIVRASCCSSEGSSTTPGFAKWPTLLTPHCPERESCSSTEGEALIHTTFLCYSRIRPYQIISLVLY
uniref:Nedd4 family interacting protein 1 n=1 Tax=Salmo trutta TaxID=8032 RepID=A0A673Y1F7_SALTR